MEGWLFLTIKRQVTVPSPEIGCRFLYLLLRHGFWTFALQRGSFRGIGLGLDAFRNLERPRAEAIPGTLLLDSAVGQEHDLVSEGEVLGYSTLASFHPVERAQAWFNLLEFVIHRTVVPLFRKRPSGPRRFSITMPSVFPSRALKLSSKTTISSCV